MADTLFAVVVTAIIARDGRLFIMRRPPGEATFPGRWTVPGGKLSLHDYAGLAKDTPHYWYNVLERALAREVKEETGLDITRVRYLTSLASAPVGVQPPSIVISCLADWAGGEPRPSEEMDQWRWVTLAEAKNFDLIEGIGEELAMAAAILRGEDPGRWTSAGA